MLDDDNHVARFLDVARSLSATFDGPLPHHIARALGTQPNTREFYWRVVALMELGERARAQILELGGPGQVPYLAALDPMLQAIREIDLQRPWSQYISAFHAGTLGQLEICVQYVNERSRYAPPSPEDVQRVLNEVEAAIAELLESDIEAEAKEILLEMLREAENALRGYRIFGIAGLRRAMERTIGASFVHHEVLKRSKNPGVVKRSVRAVGGLVTLLRNVDFVARQLPATVVQGLEFIRGLLGP